MLELKETRDESRGVPCREQMHAYRKRSESLTLRYEELPGSSEARPTLQGIRPRNCWLPLQPISKPRTEEVH